MYRRIRMRNGLVIVEVDNAAAISASIGQTRSNLDNTKKSFLQERRRVSALYRNTGPEHGRLPQIWRERYPTYNKFWEASLAGEVPDTLCGFVVRQQAAIHDYEQRLVRLDAELVLFQTGELRGTVSGACDSRPYVGSRAIACTFCLHVPAKIRCLSVSTGEGDELVGICHTCWPALYDAALPGAVAPEEDVCSEG